MNEISEYEAWERRQFPELYLDENEESGSRASGIGALKSRIVNVRVDPRTYSAISRLAFQKHLSISATVRMLVVERLYQIRNEKE